MIPTHRIVSEGISQSFSLSVSQSVNQSGFMTGCCHGSTLPLEEDTASPAVLKGATTWCEWREIARGFQLAARTPIIQFPAVTML